MTLQQAGNDLYESLKAEKWFIAVGETDFNLVVYVTRQNLVTRQLGKDGWKNFPVLICKTTRPKPAAKGFETPSSKTT